MGNNAKAFVVSTADFAYYVKGMLACTGTTNLNTSLEVSMEEQDVRAGKGNKLVYSFKYGRQLAATLQAADWKLEYIAANVGSTISQSLTDVYKIAECVTITNGVGLVGSTPIGDVAVELPNGSIVTVTPTDRTIDLKAYNITNDSVAATYKYNTIAKTVKIDAESTPFVGELVLDADRHTNKLGKIGSIQVVIPSYQLSGNFNIEFTPDGVTSTNLDGKALAVEGDTCTDGSDVYAYIKEFDDTAAAMQVNNIAATPGVIELKVGEEVAISVIGLKGSMYSPIEVDNSDCTFTSATASVATVGANTGIVRGVAEGTTNINVDYNGHKDIVEVTVIPAE